MDSWPRWWDVMFHTRPRRRRDKATMNKILKGADPDATTFDLGNTRPHVYFW